MENEIKLQALLGLKQEYVAMLLKVTRTQWSMYVLGKRDLPIKAKLKLAELLTFVNSDIAFAESKGSILSADKKTIIFENQKRNNQFQQMIVEKKLKSTAKKYTLAKASIKVVGFLETQSESLSAQEQEFWRIIKIDAIQAMEKNSEAIQEQLALKLKTLHYEATLLEEKIEIGKN